MDAVGAVEGNDDAEGDGSGRGGLAKGTTSPRRWVCHCSTPPVLLATVEGRMVNLKIRDRYYHIEGVHGRVRAICPRCGKEHMLALARDV